MRAPFESDVSSKYGAPMGRRSDAPSSLTGKCHLRRVRLYDGGCYDKGGAYWGGGSPLFCAWGYNVDGDMVVCYTRAATREAAKAQFLNAKFYR